MDVVEALERVAYLHDRKLDPSQKAAAFLKAADVVRGLPDGELERRHADRKLEELPGIGKSTAAVISQALDGKVPDRLAELEETSVIPLGEGAALRAALKGDCHLHSTWSDGGASIETMARASMALGHEYMVLTDHSPRLTVAHGLSAERLRDQLEEIAALNEKLAPFRILTGIEVDILVDGTLDQSEEMLAQLDVVVASVHSKISMPQKEMTERMVLAVASPHVDILGHCTGRKLRFPDGSVVRKQATFDAEIVFAACAQFDTAVEINCRPERQDPPDDLLELALGWECRVSIDTDAHTPGQLEWQNYGCDKAAAHGIAPETIVNTMSADDLVAWTATHAA